MAVQLLTDVVPPSTLLISSKFGYGILSADVHCSKVSKILYPKQILRHTSYCTKFDGVTQLPSFESVCSGTDIIWSLLQVLLKKQHK